MNKNILAIDIGSTKICAIIAEKIDNGQLQILGHGIVKSQGIKKGSIVNIELASKAIKKAVSDAKRISGSNIETAIVSISNSYTKSINSSGIVNIPHKDIGIKEIHRVLNTALYNANIPSEYEIIHVLPYNFKVDDQDFVEDPYGMNATRLEAEVNIIMTQKSNLSNLKKAVKSAGIDIEDIVMNGYASSIATINSDDKELGVAIIDLGGQTSTLTVYTGNAIRHSDFFGIGSNHITSDLSIALHTPLNVAEDIKLLHGDLTDTSNDSIELPIIGNDDKKSLVSLEIIRDVILARIEETLLILEKMFEKSGLKEKVGSGVILTGGGTNLKGIRDLAQSIFSNMPVRIISPNINNIKGMFEELKNPAFSSVIGLLLYKNGEHAEYEINYSQNLLHNKSVEEENLKDIKITNKLEDFDKDDSFLRSSPASEKEKISLREMTKADKNGNNQVNKVITWLKQLF
ncbi:MAG: cell division protein FtsA [Sulfurovaceae bacterium]|nr:cell division protein FtsA [Sulfurovaceae bacterium]MDD5548346.1 cell division protein FtsA [Sulfurovaceae bacterium]